MKIYPPAPVALFVYNRVKHLKQTIAAIEEACGIGYRSLYIFCDGPKNEKDAIKVKQARELLNTIKSPQEVYLVKNDRNLGLATSITTGVTKILGLHDRVIVIEDDIVISKFFLLFMDEVLSKYHNIKNVGGVSGFNDPPSTMSIPSNYKEQIYLNPRPSTWGWATWSDRWGSVDWTGEKCCKDIKKSSVRKELMKLGDDIIPWIEGYASKSVDSWAALWVHHHCINKWYTVYPVLSLVDNVGHDSAGTNTSFTSRKKYKNDLTKILKSPEVVVVKTPNTEMVKEYLKSKIGLKFKVLRIIKIIIFWKLIKRLIKSWNE